MRRTKEEAELTRCAILDAAEKLFATNGVSSTTLEAISRAAGVTRGAFYWHFKDKGEVMAALCARRVMPHQELLALAAEQGHADPLGLLESAGHEVLSIFQADEGQQRLFRILTQQGEDSDAAGRIAEHTRAVTDLLRRVAARAQQDGTLNPDFAPPEVALLLLVTMNGLLSEWLRCGKGFSLTDLGGKILSSQIAMLRSRP